MNVWLIIIFYTIITSTLLVRLLVLRKTKALNRYILVVFINFIVYIIITALFVYFIFLFFSQSIDSENATFISCSISALVSYLLIRKKYILKNTEVNNINSELLDDNL